VSTPRQFTLAIERPHEQQLGNFVPGANGELMQALAQETPGFAGFWIFGAQGSGRSHLLRGSCMRAQERSITVSYVGCTDYRDDDRGLRAALHHAEQFGELVAVDDVGGIAGRRDLESRLMNVYQRLLEGRGRLLVTAARPAQALDFVLPDLGSRMRSLQHYQIQGLQDEDKVKVLVQRARNRGYELPPAVLDYWLARGPRGLGALLTDLETLDKASLAQQRKVTIPLLKRVLGY